MKILLEVKEILVNKTKKMLPKWYTSYKNLIDKSINKYLIDYFDCEKNKWLDTIKEASLYATKWWKRIRSILALEFYLIFTNKTIDNIKYNDNIIKLCISIELLHAYSLVHDDLPCMDNDEYRRWELTVWKKYWESIATLVWDTLNSLSFEILWHIKNNNLINFFWETVWLKWMIWWQVLDLYYENNSNELNLDNLIEIHNKKTWLLIQFSIIAWILLTNKNSNFDIYKEFWQKIGLAFQIKDDLLDIEWTVEETGKSVWDWENKGFVYFMWIEKTKEYLNNLIIDCQKIIKDLNSEKLNFLIDYIWNRKK